MRRLLILLFVWLAVTVPVFGVCVEQPVTPSSLDTYDYAFAVSTNAVTNGVAFHITITAKRADIDTNYCSAHLDAVRHDDGTVIEPFKPEIPMLTIERRRRKWTVDFVVSHELLKNPELNFVFWEEAVDRANGKITPMPAGTFYEMRLMDFAPPDRDSSRLETPTYTITITGCEEYVVSCDDVKFVCVNKKTGKSISLTGCTDHSLGADGAPGHFLGYYFTNRDMTYFVSDDGEFSIERKGKTLLDEQGTWK